MKLHVKVTPEHIERGEASNTERCALALAVRAAVPHATFVHVVPTDDGLQHIDGYIRIDDQVVELPVEADYFARRFDNALPVEPIEFDLEVA